MKLMVPIITEEAVAAGAPVPPGAAIIRAVRGSATPAEVQALLRIMEAREAKAYYEPAAVWGRPKRDMWGRRV